MAEIRLNLITHEWVIIAKEKCKKPEDCIVMKEKRIRPEFVASCPFCPYPSIMPLNYTLDHGKPDTCTFKFLVAMKSLKGTE